MTAETVKTGIEAFRSKVNRADELVTKIDKLNAAKKTDELGWPLCNEVFMAGKVLLLKQASDELEAMFQPSPQPLE